MNKLMIDDVTMTYLDECGWCRNWLNEKKCLSKMRTFEVGSGLDYLPCFWRTFEKAKVKGAKVVGKGVSITPNEDNTWDAHLEADGFPPLDQKMSDFDLTMLFASGKSLGALLDARNAKINA